MNRLARLVPALALLACFASPSEADEKLAGIACRSVHLSYPAPEGTAFLNEVTVDRSAPGTYFMVCGWNKGYFGLQELANGKKLILFSVWDSNQDDPKAVAEGRRTRTVAKDPRVRIGRFGGEGTGGQSFFDFDWKIGATYRFLVRSKADGDRTEYSGYFFEPARSEWVRLVTFSTVTGGRQGMSGYYSFVEDFKRDRVSATIARRARFGEGWVLDTRDAWAPLTKARFTGDANPATNIDAGLEGPRYFLATGGETKNEGAKLKESVTLPPAPDRKAPEGFPAPPAGSTP